MRITVPVTIELTGDLEPDEHGFIPGSGDWAGGPYRADDFALQHLSVALHWPSDRFHAHSRIEVGQRAD